MSEMFKKLIELPNHPTPLEFSPKGHLKFRDKPYPWSIVEKEFDFLYNTIAENNLKRGFEACTGIGMSALAAGLAMKQTGGLLVTIDAYIEEHIGSPHYANQTPMVIENSMGFKNINFLIAHFQLENHLIPEVGWSPDDVPTKIEKHFTAPLDYVFIDGGHFDHQVLKDIKCILPYTNQETHWLFHDVDEHNGWNKEAHDFCYNVLKKSIKIMLPHSQGCENLSILVDSE